MERRQQLQFHREIRQLRHENDDESGTKMENADSHFQEGERRTARGSRQAPPPPISLFTKFHGGDLNLALNPFSHTKCIYPCCCHVQPNFVRNESESRNVKERPPERNDLVHHMEGVLPPSSLQNPHPQKPTEAHRVHPEKVRQIMHVSE